MVAERQGQHAARAMLGSAEPYGYAPFFWTRQWGVSFRYIGNTAGYDEILYRGDVEGGAFLAGYYRDNRLEAAASVGFASEIIALGESLERGENVPPEAFEAGQ